MFFLLGCNAMNVDSRMIPRLVLLDVRSPTINSQCSLETACSGSQEQLEVRLYIWSMLDEGSSS